MTIKRRLLLSNLMMIAVPVIIAAIVGSICIAIIFGVFKNGTSMGLEGTDEFYFASKGAVEFAEEYIEGNLSEDGRQNLQRLLDNSFMRMEIRCGGDTVYAYGNKTDSDDRLIAASKLLQTDGAASSGNRSIYKTTETIDNKDYDIYILCTQSEKMGANLKTVIAFSCILLVFAVFLSIFIMNRLLTRFVFRKIEYPINMLMRGADELGKGNLDFRISYDRNDEFSTVCSAFNAMAARLKLSVEQTKQNDKNRKQLMADISHDLRSPLTSIRAYVEGLLDGIAETPQLRQKYLLTIKRKAEEIDRLVNQIFTFSKLELDGYQVEMQTVKLDSEIEKILSDLADEYEKKNLNLITETLEPCRADINGELFARVIRNIIDNSAKYKTAETGEVRISLKTTGRSCILRLADNGPGVPEDALPKLFNVFYRTDPARRNTAGGSGLGLAISAKAIKSMGGLITAENAEEGGLAIVITLPLKEDNADG